MDRLKKKDAMVVARIHIARAAVAAECNKPAMPASALDTIEVNQAFATNTVALRWIRDCHEQPRGCPIVGCVDLTKRDPLPVGVLDDPSGMKYNFRKDETQPWSWRQMLAGMTEKDQCIVLGYPRCGVVSVTCAPVRGSRVHNRWHAALDIERPFGKDAPVPVWEFFVYRIDGNIVRLHAS